MSSGSVGSKVPSASPSSSGIEETPLATTGAPHDIASRIGRPAPHTGRRKTNRAQLR